MIEVKNLSLYELIQRQSWIDHDNELTKLAIEYDELPEMIDNCAELEAENMANQIRDVP